MSEFKIVSTLQLNTDQAKKALNAIKNQAKTINSKLNLAGSSGINSSTAKIGRSISASMVKSGRDLRKQLELVNSSATKSASKNTLVSTISKDSVVAERRLSKLKKQYEDLAFRRDSLLNPVGKNRADSLYEGLTEKYNYARNNPSTKSVNAFERQLGISKIQTKQLEKLESPYQRLISSGGNLKLKELEGFNKKFVELTNSPNLGSGTFQKELKGFNTELNTTLRTRGKLQQFGNDFKSAFLGFGLGHMAGVALQGTIRGIKDTTLAIDEAMTDVKKVANPSDINSKAKIDKIKSQGIEVAKEVGMSSADVLGALATSLQAGMGGMAESLAVARQSMILSNVGDMDKADATKGVNTLVKSFNLSPLKKMSVEVGGFKKETTELANALDLANYAGNNYAISSAGVVSALQRGGSVLKAYNVSLADSVALVTATNEPLQDPEKVGNGLKTIAINFAGITASAKDGTLKLNKTAQALNTIAGIDVYSNRKTGELKSMTTLLDELHGKWGKLNDDEKAGLSEAIAGKHRANVFQALMGNYNRYKQLQKEFSQGLHFGSAEKENERYVNSMAGNINRMKETITSIGNTLASSEIFGNALKIGAGSLAGLDTLLKKAKELHLLFPLLASSIMGVRGAFKSFDSSNAKTIEDFAEEADNKKLGIGTKTSGSVTTNVSNTRKENEALSENSKEIVRNSEARLENEKVKNKISSSPWGLKQTEKETEEKAKHKKNIHGVVDAMKEETKAVAQNNEAQKNALSIRQKLEPATNKIKGTLGGMKTVLGTLGSSLKAGAIDFGTTFLLSAAASGIAYAGGKAWDYLTNAVNKSKEAHENSRKTIIANQKANENNINYVKQNIGQYKKLSQEVQGYKNKPREELSQQQLENLDKYYEMGGKLAKIFPELSFKDKNGNFLLSSISNVDTLTKKLEVTKRQQESLLQAENRKLFSDNYRLATKGEKVGEGSLEKINSYNSSLKSLYDNTKKALTGVDAIFPEFNRMGGEANPNRGNYNLGNLKEMRKTFNGESKNLINDINRNYNELSKSVAEYDKLNFQNKDIASEMLYSDRRFKGYNDSKMESLQNFSSLINWGKVESPEKALSQIDSIFRRLPTREVDEFANKVSKLNNEYLTNKDYDSYKNSLKGVLDEFSRASGIPTKNLENLFQDVNRGFSSFEEKKEFDFLKSHGLKFSDLDRNDGMGAYANKLMNGYREIQNARELLMNAKDDKEILNAYDFLASSQDAPKSLKNISSALLKGKKTTEDAQRALARYMSVLENAGDKNVQNGFLDGLAGKDTKDFQKLRNELGLTMEDIKTLKDLGLDETQFKFDIDDSGLKERLSSLDQYYKDKKIEVPLDVKLKIAEANLTTKELDGMENFIKENVSKEQQNYAREYGAKFWTGTNGDVNKFLENVASSDSGRAYALKGGFADNLQKYWQDAVKLQQAFNGLNKEFQNSVKQLGDVDLVSFMTAYQGFNKTAQNIVQSRGITDLNTAKSVNDFANGLGNNFSSEEITKTIDVLVKMNGEDALNGLLDTLNGIDEQKRIEIVVALLGENGESTARGLGVLKDYFGGDEKKTKFAAEKIPTNELKNINEKNVAEMVVKYKADQGSLEKVKNPTNGQPVEVKTKVETKNNNKIDNPNINPILVPVEYGKMPDPPKLPSIKPLLIKGRNNIAGALSSALGAINGAKPNPIPITGSNAIHGALAAAKALVAATRLSIPIVGIFSGMIGGPSGGGKSGGSKSSSGSKIINPWADGTFGKITKGGTSLSPSSSNKSNETVYNYFSPKPKATQINPLATSTGASMATISSEGYSTPSSINVSFGGVAAPTAYDYMSESANFKVQKLPGYDYRQITYVDKLKYSVKEINEAFKESVEIATEFEFAVRRVEAAVKKISLALNRARGAQKIALLNLQNDQLRELNRRLEGEKQVVISMRDSYRNDMRKAGFSFTKDGTITGNYVQKRLEYAQKINKLEEKIENSKNKKTKKALEKEKKELEELLKKVEEYFKMVDKYAEIDYKKAENNAKIEDNEDEKKRTVINSWKENFSALTEKLESSVRMISNSLDILNIKMEYAFGKERLDIMDAQVSKLREMNSQLESNRNNYSLAMGNLKSHLQGYGFTFSGDAMTNYQEHLAELEKTSTLYNDIKDLANQYMDLYTDKLPSINRELENNNKKLKDMVKQKLEYTKTIEDKITSMYKKHIDERIKALEKESRARKDHFKKLREEYNNARKEADYQDDYHKKIEEIEKLEKKRDIYAKDTSQKGQKELQKLNEEIKKKTEELEKTVNRHIDDKVNKIYDDESERLDKVIEKEKERYENEFSDSELLKKAQEAIASGLFTDINGQVRSLQDALIDYVNQFEDGLSATGSLIQAELISKLEVANSVVERFKENLSLIGTESYNIGGYIQYDKFKEIESKKSLQNNTYNAPLVNIEGNVDPEFSNKVLKIVQDAMKEHTRLLREGIR